MSDRIQILVERIGAKLLERNLTEREASIDATGKPDALRYIRTRNAMPSAERLEQIASTLGTSPGWLLGGEEEKNDDTAASASPVDAVVQRRLPKSLPVFGTALAADLKLFDTDGHPVAVEQVEVNMAEPNDQMARPLALVGKKDYYVVTVWGHSMEPRHDSGRRLLVFAGRQARRGEDVVVQLRSPLDDGEVISAVLVKQLVRHKAGSVVLRQFTPGVDFELPMASVKHIHPIIPWDDALSV